MQNTRLNDSGVMLKTAKNLKLREREVTSTAMKTVLSFVIVNRFCIGTVFAQEKQPVGLPWACHIIDGSSRGADGVKLLSLSTFVTRSNSTPNIQQGISNSQVNVMTHGHTIPHSLPWTLGLSVGYWVFLEECEPRSQARLNLERGTTHRAPRDAHSPPACPGWLISTETPASSLSVCQALTVYSNVHRRMMATTVTPMDTRT